MLIIMLIKLLDLHWFGIPTAHFIHRSELRSSGAGLRMNRGRVVLWARISLSGCGIKGGD